MRGTVYDQLSPVLRRQRRQHLIRAAGMGILAGSLAGLLVGAGRWAGWSGWPLAAAAAGAIGLATSIAAAVWRWPTWETSARLVDSRCELKGRVRAALEFVAQGVPTAVHEVQVLDAADGLRRVNPREVVPPNVPRPIWPAAVILAVAIAILVWPLPARPVPPPPESLPEVLQEASVMIDGLTHMLKEAREQDDPEMEKFLADQIAKLEDLKRPGVDTREALGTLTEVGDALEALKAELAAADESYRDAGEAMTNSQSLKEAGEALKAGKYQDAAAALEKEKTNLPSAAERKTTGELLKKVAERMEKKKQERLAQATEQMATGLTANDKDRFQQACEDIIRDARQHDVRRRMIQLAEQERRRLEECKSRLASENAHRQNQNQSGNKSGGASSGAQSQSQPSGSQANQSRSGQQQTSKEGERPGSSGHSARPSEYVKVEIDPSDGLSDPVFGPPEPTKPGEEGKKVPLKQALPKAQQRAEEEIQREDIPVGYRGLVRQYFQSIQPEEKTPR